MEVHFKSEYQCREFDLEHLLLDEFVYYMKKHSLMYYWMIFVHDKNQEDCNVFYEDPQSGKLVKQLYYHVLVWFHPIKQKTGEKLYFSNTPLMQFIRRIYRSNNYLVYPRVYEIEDCQIHLEKMFRSKHPYLDEVSANPPWFDEIVKS